LQGIAYLKNKLETKRTRVLLRYKYYDMKEHIPDLKISSPPDLQYWMGTLGWCAKAVDSVADRLVFVRFDNDVLAMNEIFAQNNPDILFDSAALSALISSCSFIYISADNDGYPRLQVIDGSNATGIIDPITGLLKEGYAVLERDDRDNVITEAYFEPGRTTIITGKDKTVIPNSAPAPLLVPIIYRPDARRPFGHSRISRACMNIMGAAVRTMKRSEIAAEFYSFPQKYVTGLSQDAELLDSWSAAMSALMTFDKDEDGDKPTLGQFQQQSMQPHLEQFRMFASAFAGETGLTLDDLGFPSTNPTSSEAIKSSHETLRLTARKAQRTFGSGFLNAGYLAACLRDDFSFSRGQLADVKAIWKPVFETAPSALGQIGDAVFKINQAIPGYVNGDTIFEMTGIEGAE